MSTALFGTRSFPSQPLLSLRAGLPASPSCRGEGWSSTSSIWWPGDWRPGVLLPSSMGAGMVVVVFGRVCSWCLLSSVAQ
nr:hypothetical protein [Escherichia coli]